MEGRPLVAIGWKAMDRIRDTYVCKTSVKDRLIWNASAVYKHLTDVFKMSVLHTF